MYTRVEARGIRQSRFDGRPPGWSKSMSPHDIPHPDDGPNRNQLQHFNLIQTQRQPNHHDGPNGAYQTAMSVPAKYNKCNKTIQVQRQNQIDVVSQSWRARQPDHRCHNHGCRLRFRIRESGNFREEDRCLPIVSESMFRSISIPPDGPRVKQRNRGDLIRSNRQAGIQLSDNRKHNPQRRRHNGCLRKHFSTISSDTRHE